MNRRWITRGISVVGAVSLLAMATPAFAANLAEGLGNGSEPSQASTLTLSCNQGSVVGGQPQYVCTVGNIDITKAETTIVFRALDSSDYTAFAPSSWGESGASNQSHDDGGTLLNGLSGVTITPSPVNHWISSTKTFTLSGAIPSNTVAFSVGQNSPDLTNEVGDEAVVKLTPPVGQLPEVPYAVALPIMGLGAGLVLWRRNRQRGLR